MLRTTPAPDDLAPYYATDLAGTMKEPASALFRMLRRRLLAREVARVKRHGDPGTILDVGCGAGDFTLTARAAGLCCWAADAEVAPPVALYGAGEIPYARFDFTSYEIFGAAGRRLDTVVLRHVLEHVRDPYACLTSLCSQGATQFYVVVPNANSLECRLLGSHWYLWDPPRHLWHFDRASLTALFQRLGFYVVNSGKTTTAALAPSLYRYLRRRGAPSFLYQPFGPTSFLTGATAPLNLLLPGNVQWMLARRPSCAGMHPAVRAPRSSPSVRRLS